MKPYMVSCCAHEAVPVKSSALCEYSRCGASTAPEGPCWEERAWSIANFDLQLNSSSRAGQLARPRCLEDASPPLASGFRLSL